MVHYGGDEAQKFELEVFDRISKERGLSCLVSRLLHNGSAHVEVLLLTFFWRRRRRRQLYFVSIKEN